jgi:hypothetical protein
VWGLASGRDQYDDALEDAPAASAGPTTPPPHPGDDALLAESQASLRSHWAAEARWGDPAYYALGYDSGPAFGAALLLARRAAGTAAAEDLRRPLVLLARGWMNGEVRVLSSAAWELGNAAWMDKGVGRTPGCIESTKPSSILSLAQRMLPVHARTAWPKSHSSRRGACAGAARTRCPALQLRLSLRFWPLVTAWVWGGSCSAT